MLKKIVITSLIIALGALFNLSSQESTTSQDQKVNVVSQSGKSDWVYLSAKAPSRTTKSLKLSPTVSL